MTTESKAQTRAYHIKVNLAGSTRVYLCRSLADAQALLAVFLKARIIASLD